MSNSFVPIQTADLVWRDGLPFSNRFDDIYFSNENGLLEAEHVFITGNNLIKRWQSLSENTDESFVIAETGFGSGLNFLLAWSLWLKYAPNTARLHFISCEKFPLTHNDLTRCLALWPQLQAQADVLLAEYPILTPGFHQLQFENGRVNLTLMLGEAVYCYNQLLICGDVRLEKQLRTSFVDAWFLDGFAPAKNQAMWSEDLFHTVRLLSKTSTTLATFSAAAVVKKNLHAAGFIITKIKGFGRKREMIIARFMEANESVLQDKPKFRSTPWHVSTPTVVQNKKALIVGAGLAGCYMAYALAKRGWLVTLIDEQSEVGCGASGNRQAVLYPKLSAYRSPLTMFMLSAFLFASRAYSQLLEKQSIGVLSGILQLAFHDKEIAAQASLHEWLSTYPELGVLVDKQDGSEMAGIQLQSDGLFIPRSGWLDSQALCKLLSQTPGINWVPNTSVQELIFTNGQWHVGAHSAEVLVIANGYQAMQFMHTAYLPIKAIRGQMTIIASNKNSEKLKIPLCGDGHVLPVNNKTHAIGATYHSSAMDNICHLADDRSNLARLEKIAANLPWSNQVKSNWAGIRGATTDYLPVVGPVPKADIFKEQFLGLATNAKRWIPQAGVYHPGLFICAGFGSRGLTTIPLSAEWLAAFINDEPNFLPRSLAQALSPARFLRKELIKKSK